MLERELYSLEFTSSKKQLYILSLLRYKQSLDLYISSILFSFSIIFFSFFFIKIL
jgi:hypothetical protein